MQWIETGIKAGADVQADAAGKQTRSTRLTRPLKAKYPDKPRLAASC